MRVRTRLLPSIAAAALLLSACADGADDDTQADGVEEIDTEATDDGATDDEATDDTDDEVAAGDDAAGEDLGDPAQEAGDARIEVEESDLGSHLVDGEGRTLYLSTLDGEDESQCGADCAFVWQPLLADGEPDVGDGVDESLVGTFEREDGGTQVTYDGMPLYRFVSDEPGDTNGHGVNQTWFAVDVAGGAIGGAETAGAPADDADDAATDGEDTDDEDA